MPTFAVVMSWRATATVQVEAENAEAAGIILKHSNHLPDADEVDEVQVLGATILDVGMVSPDDRTLTMDDVDVSELDVEERHSLRLSTLS